MNIIKKLWRKLRQQDLVDKLKEDKRRMSLDQLSLAVKKLHAIDEAEKLKKKLEENKPS